MKKNNCTDGHRHIRFGQFLQHGRSAADAQHASGNRCRSCATICANKEGTTKAQGTEESQKAQRDTHAA